MSQPIVFAPDWMAKLEVRRQQLPVFQSPPLYHVANDEGFAQVRAEIEAWVRVLPARVRRKLVPRLRDPKHFANTYHELATGHVLRLSGHVPEYEPTIGGMTPDWHVLDPQGTSSFLVEAVSCNTPDEHAKKRGAWEELYERLRQIPVGVWIEPDASDDDPRLTSQHAAQIARGVRSWLERHQPRIGTVIEVSGRRLRVFGVDESVGNVICVPPPEAFWVDPGKLRDSIAEKAHKYSELCASESLPLVVSVVASFATGLGTDDLEEVLYGTAPAHRSAGSCTWDGLFHRYSHLAAVLSLRHEADGWKWIAFENPGVAGKLTDPLFEAFART